MASSTTMPMASTSPNSVRLFRLKPKAAMTAKVPMIATGTATSGMIADRQFCKNNSTTTATRMTASRSVLHDFVDRFARVRRCVEADIVVDALGKALLQLLHLGEHALVKVEGVGVGHLEDRQKDGLLSVETCADVFISRPSSTRPTSLIRVIRPSGVRLEDDVLELLGLCQATERAQRDLHFLAAGHRLLTDRAGGDLRVLLANR